LKQVLQRWAHAAKDYFPLEALDSSLYYVLVHFYTGLDGDIAEELKIVDELDDMADNSLPSNACLFNICMLSKSKIYVQCAHNTLNDPQIT